MLARPRSTQRFWGSRGRGGTQFAGFGPATLNSNSFSTSEAVLKRPLTRLLPPRFNLLSARGRRGGEGVGKDRGKLQTERGNLVRVSGFH